MRTSGPGSSGPGRRPGPGVPGHRPRTSGFTLIELLVVIAIIAISVGVVSLALRDRGASRLDQDGERLAVLLEMARAEARAAGSTVLWVPGVRPGGDGSQFRFVGLPAAQALPTHWLDPDTRAVVVGAGSVRLGPDAILPPQRIELQLGAYRLQIASDGLGPFTAEPAAALP
ncbi:MAG: prepilin-type N-terminal cleavage/methylation domain-containing protein [Burkholderiales bacterium]|nr:prepilin-type N-terminal cleavage/methylation domain-containing protein [Burkholderiales bacterium]MDE2276519.1 prepilin-type N-terminal cleavage/methylation domain-containing protein [Burkholderiales bacterium]